MESCASASGAPAGERTVLMAVSALTVFLSWGVVQTVFALRYAHEYYSDPMGGIDFGDGELEITGDSALFEGVWKTGERDTVWMSHGDRVTQLPAGFKVVGVSKGAPFAAIADEKRKLYAVQFHPEVAHTPRGSALIGNFVRRNYCHHNGRWGIFTGYALNVRIDNNETSYSAAEHGIYVSNSSDNPYIRWNRAHHNRASGIQINADPALPGDGIISGAVVSRNIAYENGVGGGAAINLASVRNSLISNNLLFNNHASGIAGWDDGVGNTFGTQGNRFFNNTIVQASDGRFALVSIWEQQGAVVVYDARTLEEVKRIPMVKPSGKYNVYNKTTRSTGTSH